MKHIAQSYFSETRGITLTCKIDNISMPLNVAVPCVQIISELVSNVIQHAFGAGAKGDIIVEMRESVQGMYRIIVQDNGEGMDSVPCRESETTGLQIVKALIAQINGKHEIDFNNGIRHTVSFKVQV